MLIGIIGKKGSGKDTIAQYLAKEYNFQTYAFAEPLKRSIQKMFDLSDKQLYDEKYKEEIDPRWGVSPRELFQKIGTEFFQRDIYTYFPNLQVQPRLFWVKHFQQWYLSEIEKNPDLKILVTDVRFLHEFKAIKELGGMIFKVERLAGESHYDKNVTHPHYEQYKTHTSETELDDLEYQNIDYLIGNNGTIEDLFETVRSFMDLL